MTTETHKAVRTNWRENVLNALNMKYEVKKNQIIYRGELNETLVSFLVTKSKELGIQAY